MIRYDLATMDMKDYIKVSDNPVQYLICSKSGKYLIGACPKAVHVWSEENGMKLFSCLDMAECVLIYVFIFVYSIVYTEL